MNTVRIAAALVSFAVLGLAAAPLAAAAGSTEIENWPCKNPYKEALTADEIWGGPAPAADGDWHQDQAVSKLVTFATNPENPPASGRKAISDLAKQAGTGAEKQHTLLLAFRGMVDETNALRGAILSGIRNMKIRAIILDDAVKDDDRMLADLPNSPDAESKRQDIKAARKFNFRNKDDSEEEADFLCYRLNYVEKKLRSLTEQVQHEVGG
ncbi:MAG: hypothetical protein WCF16_01025 [Alphaproteobacteria bacterium]